MAHGSEYTGRRLRPSGTTILLFASACALAALCALALYLLERMLGRRDRAAWLTLGVQLLLSSWVLVPAVLGEPWFSVAITITVLSAFRELSRALAGVLRGAARQVARAAAFLLFFMCALALIRTRAEGARHIYFLFGAVELNDSFAFIVGRSLGRRPVFPQLSPNKTLEGLLAGLCAAAGTGALLVFFEPQWSRAACALIGLALGVAGTGADLLASWWKRRAAIKDFSTTLPGHGGVLDAYDSFLLAAPLWYVVLLVFAA